MQSRMEGAVELESETDLACWLAERCVRESSRARSSMLIEDRIGGRALSDSSGGTGSMWPAV